MNKKSRFQAAFLGFIKKKLYLCISLKTDSVIELCKILQRQKKNEL